MIAYNKPHTTHARVATTDFPQAHTTHARVATTDFPQAKSMMQQKKDNTVHSFAVDECTAFVNHINRKLGGDKSLSYLLPLSTDDVSSLFRSVTDGVILCKLINEAVPETIDERCDEGVVCGQPVLCSRWLVAAK